MFETISKLSAEKRELILDLTPLAENEIRVQKERYPDCPVAYWKFLATFGYGKIKEPNEPANYPANFEFTKVLVSAELEYYKDTLVYENGAKGDILFFGFDSMGNGVGFDSGDDYQIVQVDNYRIVEKLNLDFKNFFVGLLICFPDLPVSYRGGKWKVATGEEYEF